MAVNTAQLPGYPNPKTTLACTWGRHGECMGRVYSRGFPNSKWRDLGPCECRHHTERRA